MKKALLIGLLASVSTAQAGSLTLKKPSFPSSSPSSHSSPAAPSSGPVIGKNVPQNNTAASTPPASSASHSPTPATPAAATPAPTAGSGMGGIVGGMAAGALLGAGATMLLSDSGASTPAATGTVANATIMPYSGNVEQDFMSGMLLWQNKNYAELINITNPYLACTNCSDKDKFMMELNRLGKLNVGTK